MWDVLSTGETRGRIIAVCGMQEQCIVSSWTLVSRARNYRWLVVERVRYEKAGARELDVKRERAAKAIEQRKRVLRCLNPYGTSAVAGD